MGELPKPSRPGRRGVNVFGNIHNKAADANPSVTCAIVNRRGLTISSSTTSLRVLPLRLIEHQPDSHLPPPFGVAQTNSRTF
jgi:hypothetical protein